MFDKRIFLTRVDLRHPRTGCVWPCKSGVHDRSGVLLPVPSSSTSGTKQLTGVGVPHHAADTEWITPWWLGRQKHPFCSSVTRPLFYFCLNQWFSRTGSFISFSWLWQVMLRGDVSDFTSFFFIILSVWRDSALSFSCSPADTRSMELKSYQFPQCLWLFYIAFS